MLKKNSLKKKKFGVTVKKFFSTKKSAKIHSAKIYFNKKNSVEKNSPKKNSTENKISAAEKKCGVPLKTLSILC